MNDLQPLNKFMKAHTSHLDMFGMKTDSIEIILEWNIEWIEFREKRVDCFFLFVYFFALAV